MAVTVPPPSKSVSLLPPAVARPKKEDWRPAFHATLREIFIVRLRVATVVSLVLHAAGYAAFPDQDASMASMIVRIGLIPFMALLLALSYWPRTRKASSYLSILFLLSWAAFIVWNNAVGGNPFETKAILFPVKSWQVQGCALRDHESHQ